MPCSTALDACLHSFAASSIPVLYRLLTLYVNPISQIAVHRPSSNDDLEIHRLQSNMHNRQVH